MLSINFENPSRRSTTELYSIAVLILFAISFLIYESVRWSARIPKFAGPLGVPVYGNLWQIHNKDAPKQYRDWSYKYGPVYQIQLGNIPILIINTAAAAKKILTQNSHATASRPEFYTFHKAWVISNKTATTIGTSPYNESLKKRRKIFASALNRPAVATYVPHIDRETKVLLKEAFEIGKAGKDAFDPIPLLLRMNLSLGFTLHWGARVETQSDLFREIVYCENAISNFRSTTSNWQDYIPALRLNPFSPVSAKARDISARRTSYMSKMDRELDEKLEKGTHASCIRANVKLDPEGKLNESELTSLNVTMTAAGLDTMQSTVSWGIAILSMKPDIQEKALKEIRKKYPEDQPLCDASDDQTIEYISVLAKEISRCYPATRLSLPRLTMQDITYEGKVIPKNSIIFLNAWACNMDSDIWTDPEVFRPERWLEQRDAPIFSFGMGSRMCIGIQMANRELYILLMRLIASFKIEPESRIDLDPISGVMNVSATVSNPKPYKVKFIPRDVLALEEALGVTENTTS